MVRCSLLDAPFRRLLTVSATTAPCSPYDAFLLVSFGGPEKNDDVLPFLENVLRGKNVPRDRMLAVAEHYYHFGGKSPINDQNRELLEKLRLEFDLHGIHLPIYFGNRNWNPLLKDTIQEMADAGVRRALAFFTSAYSSYSGCRQYRENILQACQMVGEKAPRVDKLRAYFNHPGFIEVMVERIREAISSSHGTLPGSLYTLFTAHSIPVSMAQGCNYSRQLEDTSRLVAQKSGLTSWELVYQSRSGPPSQPWLEPDVVSRIRELAASHQPPKHLLIVPIGFISDHMEVIHDLDQEAAGLCAELNLPLTRVKTAGVHPRFLQMIRELVQERLNDTPLANRPSLGCFPPAPDICPLDCCLPGSKPGLLHPT